MKTLERTGNGRAGDAAPERWVRAGLMTEAEAAAIERFERGRAVARMRPLIRRTPARGERRPEGARR